MREIKFRVWDKYRKRFCEWREACALVETENSETQMRIGIIELNNNDESSYIFSQYTGLKDKNGKEIYEGDLVKDGYNHKYEVFYINGEFALVYPENGTYFQRAYSYANEFCEIIGNIYETNGGKK